VENEFLNYFIAFEEQFAEGKQTTVYRYIGQPSWTPAYQLNDAQINSDKHGAPLCPIHPCPPCCQAKHFVQCRQQNLVPIYHRRTFRPGNDGDPHSGHMDEFYLRRFSSQSRIRFGTGGSGFFSRHSTDKCGHGRLDFNKNLKVNLGPELDTEKAIVKVKNFINSWTNVIIQRSNIISVEVTDDDQEAIVTFEKVYEATVKTAPKKCYLKGIARSNWITFSNDWNV